jgi:hypothetical protein
VSWSLITVVWRVSSFSGQLPLNLFNRPEKGAGELIRNIRELVLNNNPLTGELCPLLGAVLCLPATLKAAMLNFLKFSARAISLSSVCGVLGLN